MVRQQPTTLTCPKCSSASLRRLRDIHGKPPLGETLFARGGKGTTAALATGARRQLVELSRKAAPPARKWVLGWVLLAMACCGLLMLGVHSAPRALAAITFGVASIWLSIRARRFNVKALPPLIRRWEHSWMCGRCGEVFAGPDG